MARCGAMLMAMLLALGPVGAWARGHGSGHSSGSRSSYSSGSHSYRSSSHGTSSHSSRSSGSTHRSSHGKYRRDPEQRARFMRQYPCPSTGRTSGACKGYVVDHVVPLKRGGADAPSNMQWQTTQAAKAKDKWE